MDGRESLQFSFSHAARDEGAVRFSYTENFHSASRVLDEGVQFLAKRFTVDALARRIRDILDEIGSRKGTTG